MSIANDKNSRAKINIAWGITGSGTFIRDVFNLMKEIKNEVDINITTFLSKAAEEVIRIYGLLDKLREISPGGYYQEIITERSTGYSCVHSGRFNLGRYRLLVVAPATSNTVAKIVHGIADTVVTNIVSQALKGSTQVIILPSDITDITEVPCMIDRESCIKCMECMDKCVYDSISIVDEKPRINLMECYGCRVCENICPVNAVSCFRKIKVKIRDLDKANIDKLSMIKGVLVVDNIDNLEKIIKKLLFRRKNYSESL